MLLLPILAAVMSTPQKNDSDLWKKLNSFLGRGDIKVAMFVNPDGIVESCTVEYSQLPKSQSDKFCSSAKGSKLAKPAIGPDGNPAYGMLSLIRITVEVLTMSPHPTPPKLELPPDLELTVPDLPKQFRKSLRVSLTVMIDDHGTATACQGDAKDPPDYAKAACDQVKMLKGPVRQDAAGVPVPYMDDMVVEFAVSGS